MRLLNGRLTSVGGRLAALGVATVALSLALVCLLHLVELRRQLRSDAEIDTQIVATVVENSFEILMTANARHRLSEVLETVALNPTVEEVSMLDANGRVRLSSRRELVGLADEEARRVAEDKPFDVRRGLGVTTYRPVSQIPKCQRCHDPNSPITGAIKIATRNEAHGALYGYLVLTVITTGLIALLAAGTVMSIGTHRLLSEPLAALVGTMRGERGDERSPQPLARREDEMGELARAFDGLLDRIAAVRDRELATTAALAAARAELDYRDRLGALDVKLGRQVEQTEQAQLHAADLSGDLVAANQDLSERVTRLTALHELGMLLAASSDRAEIAHHTARLAAETLAVPVGLLLCDDGAGLRPFVRSDSARFELSEDWRRRIAEDVIGGGQRLTGKIVGAAAFAAVPVAFRDGPALALVVADEHRTRPFADTELEFLGTMAAQAGLGMDLAALQDNLRKATLDTVRVLVNALEAKDPFTRGHSDRVTELAMAVARCMGLDDSSTELLRYAGILHDIGKIAIDLSVLAKPGPLTREEVDRLREHPVIGEEILKPLAFLAAARLPIRRHHERYDGGGYPDGVGGSDLTLETRILTVADCYEAMTGRRSYRPTWSHERAVAELRRCAGTQFDPKVVAAFAQIPPDDIPRLRDGLNPLEPAALNPMGGALREEALN